MNIKYKKITYEKIFYIFFVVILGCVYIPFLSFMPNVWFRDRYNYIIYAQSSDNIMSSYDGVALFFNEPLFLILNGFLKNYVNYDNIPNLYVFFIVTIFYIGLFKYSKNFLTFTFGLLLSLTIPYILQSELVALRQSIATAILIIGFMFVKDDKKIAFIIFLCSFIHSIFFIFLIFFILNFFLINHRNLNTKILINFILMIFISLFSIALAKFFGLRQGDEYNQSMNVASSGGAFLVFLSVFVYLFFWGDDSNQRLYQFTMIGLVMFLTAYFLTPISGRLFNTVIPFVIFLLISKSRFQDLLLLMALFFIFLTLLFLGSYKDLLAISEVEFFSSFALYFRDFLTL